MHRYLFGPVYSRRLGLSLGVELVPLKLCSFDCVYCECGPTDTLTTARDEYVPIDRVEDELSRFLSTHPPPDYITFSGPGEPTLNSGIGRIIRFAKTDYPHIPTAVLTNGSLLSDPQVRADLCAADVVLPSLDAASGHAFRRIDRPAPGLELSAYIEGLEAFRAEYSGEIRLEVMVLPGVNDDWDNLKLLKDAFVRVRPDLIQVNTLDRPGTLADIEAASWETLHAIADYWADVAPAEVIE